MVVYVKMIQSKLYFSKVKRVFNILKVKHNYGSWCLVPYHPQLSETLCIEATKIFCKIFEKNVDREKVRLYERIF